MTSPYYPRRRARPPRRLWAQEVPEAFGVPDVPESFTGASANEGGDGATETVLGTSGDRSVEVAVDLRGVIQHMRIDPKALRGPHPQRVGRAVVEALADARGRASRLARERTAK